MDNLSVKLTDYTLSCDLFPQDYKCRPLKFMHIESIKDRRFSTTSNIWPDGILIWELISPGLQLYVDIDPSNLITHLRFKFMSACWTFSTDQRPSMSSLLQSVIRFYEQLVRFIQYQAFIMSDE